MRELSFADISRHFDLPLTQAAERLNVCVTLVKRVCRENGVSRWPYRKLQSRRRRELLVRQPARHASRPLDEPQVADSDATLKGLVDFVEAQDDNAAESSAREAPALALALPPVQEPSSTQPSGAMLLRAACKRLGFVYAEVWTPVSSSMLTLHSCSASEDDQSDPMHPFALASRQISLAAGSGLPGRVWAKMQPEWSTDCSARSLGLATAAGIPLLSPSGRSRFLGVAVFFATQRAGSTLEIMQALGNVGAMLACHLAAIPLAHSAGQQIACALAVGSGEAERAGGGAYAGAEAGRGGPQPLPQQPLPAHAGVARPAPHPASHLAGSALQQRAQAPAGVAPPAQLGQPRGLAPSAAPQAAAGAAQSSAAAGAVGSTAGSGAVGLSLPMGPPSHVPAGRRPGCAQLGLPQLGLPAPHQLSPHAHLRSLGSPLLTAAPGGAPGGGGECEADMAALTEFAQTATRLVQEGLLQVARKGATVALEQVARGFSAELARLAARRPAARRALAGDAPSFALPPPLMPLTAEGSGCAGVGGPDAGAPQRHAGAAQVAAPAAALPPAAACAALAEAAPAAPAAPDVARGTSDIDLLATSAAARTRAVIAPSAQPSATPAYPGARAGDGVRSSERGAAYLDLLSAFVHRAGQDGAAARGLALPGGGGGNGADAAAVEPPAVDGADEPVARRARRGRTLSYADVSRHFDLPLTQAAERLNVCVTLIKRICRENGVSRWPHRKLQSRKAKKLTAAGYTRHAPGEADVARRSEAAPALAVAQAHEPTLSPLISIHT